MTAPATDRPATHRAVPSVKDIYTRAGLIQAAFAVLFWVLVAVWPTDGLAWTSALVWTAAAVGTWSGWCLGAWAHRRKRNAIRRALHLPKE